MKSKSPKTSISLLGVVCSAIGHDYIITKKITNHINEYKCANCGREVTDNSSGKLEILTYRAKELNATLSSFFQKKSRRLSAS